MSQDKPHFILVTHHVTSKQTKGHPHWFYKSFKEAITSAGSTFKEIGPRQPHSKPQAQLGYDESSRSFAVMFPHKMLEVDVQAVLSALEPERLNILHFYEGSLRELVLAYHLKKLVPDLVVILNLNYSDDWHFIFTSKSILSFATAQILRRIHDKFYPNFQFYAESQSLAKIYQEKTGFRWFDYPLFSTLEVSAEVPKSLTARECDIIFFPSSHREAEEVLHSIPADGSINAVMVPRWSWLPPESINRLAENLGVKVVSGLLGSQEYSELLLSSKVAVFPYREKLYEWASSGRLLDSAAAGCICLAPEGTLPGQEITLNGWGLAYLEGELGSTITDVLTEKISPVREEVTDARFAVATLIARIPIETISSNKGSRIQAFSMRIASLIIRVATGSRRWLPRLYFELRDGLKMRKRRVR